MTPCEHLWGLYSDSNQGHLVYPGNKGHLVTEGIWSTLVNEDI